MTPDSTVRQARPEDHDAVAAFSADTWADREFEDYVPEAFPEWVETDGPDQHTVVATVDGNPVGVAQATMLTADEAWLQGLRVHPDHRGRGHSMAMTDALLAWCRERGATAARNMVFDWNPAGMAQSRAAGLAPVTACRWARPEPRADADPSAGADLSVRADADAAWRYWTHSDTRERLDGLALADEETWALAELTRERFEKLAADGRALAVVGEDVRGMTVRRGTRERDGETVLDYAVAAWADADAARALFDAIRADAAGLGDRTRVPVPETPRHVSDAALARAPLSDHSVYVFAADLDCDNTHVLPAP